MTELKGSCHMCGKCCEAIHIPYTPKEIKERAERTATYSNNDFKFVNENWTPITKEEAFEINPHFAVMEGKGVNYSRMSWYACQQHDKETKLCKVHDSRPHVCSGYPWYDHGVQPTEPFYSMDCGYKEDVEGKWVYKDEEPVHHKG